jgi:Zn-dependent protease
MTDLFSTIVLKIVPLFFAIVLHEISHGLAAYSLGDDTAKKAGRFKLYTHFDLWGSFLIPLSLYLMHAPFLIGYAKPVPVDPRKFKDPLVDMALVAIAGPLCNILLAAFGAVILKNMTYGYSEFTIQLCLSFIVVNLALFFFNLIPIPPLDGSRILAAVIPKSYVGRFYSIEPFGFLIIISLQIASKQISELSGYNVELFYIFIEKPLRAILSMLLS